ncbi:hypothetical protein PMAYCL1PPCAC_04720, partial [Pristionchus mayeri]
FEKDKPVPTDATHYFMRTRTDFLNNRWQGSFERANGAKFKATFACEFHAKFTEGQKWYCDKLAKLGKDAVYDEKNHRCLYVSSKYTFNRDTKETAKGCNEAPSDLRSGGMDDGTADPEVYTKLRYTGALRLAGYMTKEKIAE